MNIGDLTLIVTVFVLFVLSVRFIVLAVKRDRVRAQRTLVVGGTLAGAYVVCLVVVGLTSVPSVLVLGQLKCFDEWCFSVDSIEREDGGFLLGIAIHNLGRRAQRPDSPHVSVVLDGLDVPLDVPWLGDQVRGRFSVYRVLHVPVPTGTHTAQFKVTEGGFPSRLSIGDENSPFHSKSVWILPTRDHGS